MSIEMKLIREDTEDLMSDYFKKHPLAKECAGEYIYQNDKAQVDALDLVANICQLYVDLEITKKM